MTAGRLILDDGELSYDRRGEGPPVVLLHGGGLGGVTWDRQFALLAQDHTVIRYDARGHGGSSPVTGPFAHHEDLKDLLDGLGLDRVTLVGLSLGARTAIDFALLHPDRVVDLVLVGPGVSGMKTEDPFIVDQVARLRAATAVDEVAECLLRMWVDGPHRSPDEVDPAVRELCRGLTAHAVSRGAFTVQPDELHAVDRLRELRARTLVVVGDLDSSDIHGVADLVRESAPRVEEVVVEDAGHLVNLDRPDEFDRALLRFLSASR
ncbi:pimeloyl-ACP methyl ester carboxylesterase [Saccharothrix carnea]|uniref:Pimeloyl-ACP methyl ester carboxylesterase n=1 Tax=Saccharothrix carnea TaxID=1280637 RepID=A0A2P8I501_SACCR|nr:alpha/beta fold hydrolase [Saccharothrix carnea]PSL53524.1 pimeloyl-ACP methyl ester carboxylesterase [Saccharothrix carnea]